MLMWQKSYIFHWKSGRMIIWPIFTVGCDYGLGQGQQKSDKTYEGDLRLLRVQVIDYDYKVLVVRDVTQPHTHLKMLLEL